MDKKLQILILKYIRKAKEVTRGQVITVINQSSGYERIDIQEAINILLKDDKKIRIVGRADTLSLTKRGHEALAPWYKKAFNFIRDIIKGFIKIKININE